MGWPRQPDAIPHYAIRYCVYIFLFTVLLLDSFYLNQQTDVVWNARQTVADVILASGNGGFKITATHLALEIWALIATIGSGLEHDWIGFAADIDHLIF